MGNPKVLAIQKAIETKRIWVKCMESECVVLQVMVVPGLKVTNES